MKPKVEYNIYEVHEFFKKDTKRVVKILSKMVDEKLIEPVEARKNLDMHLCMLTFLEVCVGMAEAEKYLKDGSFSAMHIYAKNEQESSGNEKLKSALKSL